MLGVGDRRWSPLSSVEDPFTEPNAPGIQHFQRFLPNGPQNLHLTLAGRSGFHLGFRIHSALVLNLHCMNPEEVRNDDHSDCSSSIVSARWRRVGIFSLARITGRLQFDQASTRNYAGHCGTARDVIAHYVTSTRLG